ncbi:MAG: aldo/keto reductase, partial [Thermodesulfobacteriota bacterium]|nr:aldo/keto reductase [Thermodesulfobacteriota bacterium]
MEYGVSNKTGKPDFRTAYDIVRTAWDHGITYFDTAQAYGDSEEVLGKCIKELRTGNKAQPSVISKLILNNDFYDIDRILKRVDVSIEKLGLNELWGLMLHRESYLDRGRNFLTNIVSILKSSKKIKNFGVSVYSAEKAIEALNMPEIDIVQVPFNVFDQRALDKGVFHLAAEKKKTVFIRSVYLQGLLLLNPNQVQDNLSFSRDMLKKYHSFSRDCDIPPKLLALTFVLKKAPDAMIVIGSENAEQVKENVFLLREAKEVCLPDISFLSTTDPRLINPSLWHQ